MQADEPSSHRHEHIQYIEQMDEKPEDYSQEDDAGLDLIDFYVLPHYLT